MENFCVATLSNADLFVDEIKSNDIRILPIKYLIGKFYREESSDSAHLYRKFYENLRNGGSCKLKTPQKRDYDEFFDALIMSGKTRILYLATSSQISADYDTARKAAADSMVKFKKSEILVLDTKCTAMQKGILALKAASLRQELSLGEAFVEISALAQNQCLFTVVYDGERVSSTRKVKGGSLSSGSMVGVKPVLTVDEKGELALFKRCRGEKNAVANVLAYAEKTGVDKTSFYVYCADNTRNELFAIKMIQEKFPGCCVRVGKAGMINGLLYAPNALFIGFRGTRPVYEPSKKPPKVYDDRFLSEDV